MIKRFIVVILSTLFVITVGGTPVQAALTDLSCEYYASQRASADFAVIYPGKVLSAPNCQFPAGTTLVYKWYLGSNLVSDSESYTAPDQIGSRLDLVIRASNPNFNTTSIPFIGTIKCTLPPVSLSAGGVLTPTRPMTVTATSADTTTTFSHTGTSGPDMTITAVSRGVAKIETTSVHRFNSGMNFTVIQSKTNCNSNSASLRIPLGHQIGPVVFGSTSGDALRVGAPIVLKRLALSSTATISYEWEVGGSFYTTSTYLPVQGDLGKRVELLITVDDPAAGWAKRTEAVVYEHGTNTGYIYSAISTPTPSPTPSPTQPATGNQPGGNSGVVGGGETPKPNVSSQPSPSASQSASPSATPVKTVVPAKPVAPVTARAYASCTALRKAFVNGVARDATALKRYKAKAKPILNNSVYRLNIKLDTDKDGLACER